jgi:outer membrane lipoprotein LolB
VNTRFHSLLLSLVLLLSVVGCASPTHAPENKMGQSASWNGRMSVRVASLTPTSGSQSFSSTFELRGDPTQGQLRFYTPLGSTAASIDWSPQQAQLQSGSETRIFNNITELIESVLGTPVPVAALFAWLAGKQLSLDGWQVDQSQFDSGKITARRISPAPEAEIRVVLEP